MTNENEIHQQPQEQKPSWSLNPINLLLFVINVILFISLVTGLGGYLFGHGSSQNPSQGNRDVSVQPSSIPNQRTFMIPTHPPFNPKTFYLAPTSFYPVPTTNPMLTASWKTYMSEKYGFSFRYPEDMYANAIICYIKKFKCHLDHMSLNTFQAPPGTGFDELQSQSELMKEGPGGLYLYVTSDPNHPGYVTGPSDIKHEGIVIGGKIVNEGAFSRDSSDGVSYRRNIMIPLTKNSNETIYIQIQYENTGKGAVTIDEFNQILSTFKFTH